MRNRNYWILTDTHFGHDKLVKSGYRKEGFEEGILRNLNNKLGDNDVVIHLGDVAFYKTAYWNARFIDTIKRYHARAWLIRGNHDHETLGWYLRMGWDFVGDEMTIDLYGKKILLTHEPVKLRHRFDINIHGHLHNLEWRHDITRFFNVLVHIEDTLAPFNLRTLVEDYERNNREIKARG